MKPVERMLRRRQLTALLRRDSKLVVLRRAAITRTPAGGYKKGEYLPLAPQWVALVPWRRRVSTFVVNSVAGDIPELAVSLVGPPDLDIQKGDRFTHEDQEYEVIQIDPDREIRTSCQANFFGSPQ